MAGEGLDAFGPITVCGMPFSGTMIRFMLPTRAGCWEPAPTSMLDSNSEIVVATPTANQRPELRMT
jgi:hypothetical protein